MANLSNINNKFLFTDGDFLKIGSLAPINNISGTESGISITNGNCASITVDNSAAEGKTFSIYSAVNGSLNFYDVDAASGRLVIDTSGNATFAGTVLIDGVSNYTGLVVKGSGASRPAITWSNVNQGDLGIIYGTESNALVIATGASGLAALTLDSSQNATFAGDINLAAGKKLQYSANSFMTPENNVTGAEISTAGDFRIKTGSTPTLALTIGGTQNATFAGSVTGTTAIFSGSGTILSLNRNAPGSALIELKIANTIEGYLGATTAKNFVVYNEAGNEKAHVENNGNIGLYGSAINFLIGGFAEINFRESGAITIDSDNNQSSRSFQFKDGNGSSLMFIKDTGNVGIDNTNPGAKLVVGANVNSNASGIEVNAGASGGNVLSNGTADNWFPYVDNNNYYSASNHIFRSETNSSTRMTITSTGAIALGTSATAYGAAGEVLTSNGNASPSWQVAGGGLTPAVLEQTWTFTAAQLNAGFGGSGYTLIAAPGGGTTGPGATYVVIQESYWMTTGTVTSNSGLQLEARQSNQIPGVQTVTRVNSTQWNYMTNNNSGNGMLYRPAVTGNAVVRPYLPGAGTTLHRVSGGTLPSGFTNLKLKLVYKLFTSANI
jgi:hypothetical protein